MRTAPRDDLFFIFQPRYGTQRLLIKDAASQDYPNNEELSILSAH